MTFANLRFTPGQRILILIVALCVFTVFGSAIISMFMHDGLTTTSIRISTVIQDCVIFILPAIVSALLISPYPARFLGIDKVFDIRMLILALMAMIVSIPAMNSLVAFNESLTLPDSLSGIENLMRNAEEQAQESVKILLGRHSIGSLIVNILIVGVLAGLSEEIFFRGALQRILLSGRMNVHLAIWLTAFIFSAFHLQFFGFLPRLLLGAYFGYLFYWSRSLWLAVIMHTFNNSIVVYSMWKANGVEVTSENESINNLGVGSPVLIIASIILSVVFLRQLYNVSRHYVFDEPDSGELPEERKEG
ncbi:MAG: CPBP family intramembrane metalloprotease [Bacteroides sp.]|nr:CPBP family intramembrane metalloprotease [Bacteroides sp.]